MVARFLARRQGLRPQALPSVERFAAHLAAAYGSGVAALEDGGDPVGDVVVADLRSLGGRAARRRLGELRRALDEAVAGVVVGDGSLEGLEHRLSSAGVTVELSGLTADEPGTKDIPIALVANNRAPRPGTPAPEGFRVVAFTCVFNEADVFESCLRALIAEGIEVYVLDNWSTDGTAEIAARYLGHGVIAVERFPADGPKASFNWKDVHGRIEELATRIDADWYLHVDADERRAGPWPGISLRDAVAHVDRTGFTAVDHTLLVFQPVDDSYQPGDPEEHFRFFEFGRRPGHFLQVKTWKNLGVPVNRRDTGGHDTQVPGRRARHAGSRPAGTTRRLPAGGSSR